jgi:glutathione S-transferase
MMPKVYGVNLSPFVRKVRVALAEKNIAYELEPVLPFAQSEEFRKLSPLGKIPVYRDGDFTVPDSSVIISYLEQTQPRPALYPSEPKDRARALFLEEYADTKIVETALTPFIQRIVNKRFLNQECDEAAVTQALSETLPPVLDYLEGQVSGGDAIVGASFSVADIAIASPLVNFMHGGEEVDPSRWPKLAAYLRAVYARPSFRSLIAEETRDLA